MILLLLSQHHLQQTMPYYTLSSLTLHIIFITIFSPYLLVFGVDTRIEVYRYMAECLNDGIVLCLVLIIPRAMTYASFHWIRSYFVLQARTKSVSWSSYSERPSFKRRFLGDQKINDGLFWQWDSALINLQSFMCSFIQSLM